MGKTLPMPVKVMGGDLQMVDSPILSHIVAPDIQIGDVFEVQGVAAEVVDEHDGLYHLRGSSVDGYFTAEQIAQFERVRGV